MWSACWVSVYCGYAAEKLEKASCREGSDSWLVKWVFGNRNEVVDLAKLDLEILVVVVGRCLGLLGSIRLRKGAARQPWAQGWEASPAQRDSISIFFSPSFGTGKSSILETDLAYFVLSFPFTGLTALAKCDYAWVSVG